MRWSLIPFFLPVSPSSPPHPPAPTHTLLDNWQSLRVKKAIITLGHRNAEASTPNNWINPTQAQINKENASQWKKALELVGPRQKTWEIATIASNDYQLFLKNRPKFAILIMSSLPLRFFFSRNIVPLLYVGWLCTTNSFSLDQYCLESASSATESWSLPDINVDMCNHVWLTEGYNVPMIFVLSK